MSCLDSRIPINCFQAVDFEEDLADMKSWFQARGHPSEFVQAIGITNELRKSPKGYHYSLLAL